MPGADTSTVSGQALYGTFGTTVPFSAAKIAFVKKWDEATSGEAAQAYLLPADADDIVAAQSNVGG